MINLIRYFSIALIAISLQSLPSYGTEKKQHSSYLNSPAGTNYPSNSAYNNSKPSVAENGSYYGEQSALTGKPKKIHVRGYYRKNGTYVRGHYRSR